jgi:hypothetical protein
MPAERAAAQGAAGCDLSRKPAGSGAGLRFGHSSRAKGSRGVGIGKRQEQRDPMMTALQTSLVESSWARVRPGARHLADLFYDRLFELDPLLEESMELDLTEQGRVFIAILEGAIQRLAQLHAAPPAGQSGSDRSATTGLTGELPLTIGKALLWALEQSLHEDFTPSLHDAWAAMNEILGVEIARQLRLPPRPPRKAGGAPSPASLAGRGSRA